MRKTKEDRKRKERPEKTTMRAGLSGIESEALKDYLKYRCGGMTIDDALKQALDMWLERGGRTSLAELAAKYAKRKKEQGRFVQEELF